MKKCTGCQVERPLEAFAWRNKTTGKRASRCKECQRAAIQDHYRKNRDYYYAKNIRREKELREVVDKAKRNPCADCGKSYPARAMDFHHRNDVVKRNNISQLWQLGSRTRLLDELAKCILLCAVCHRLRH